jgi:hypothetical protein
MLRWYSNFGQPTYNYGEWRMVNKYELSYFCGVTYLKCPVCDSPYAVTPNPVNAICDGYPIETWGSPRLLCSSCSVFEEFNETGKISQEKSSRRKEEEEQHYLARVALDNLLEAAWRTTMGYEDEGVIFDTETSGTSTDVENLYDDWIDPPTEENIMADDK